MAIAYLNNNKNNIGDIAQEFFIYLHALRGRSANIAGAHMRQRLPHRLPRKNISHLEHTTGFKYKTQSQTTHHFLDHIDAFGKYPRKSFLRLRKKEVGSVRNTLYAQMAVSNRKTIKKMTTRVPRHILAITSTISINLSNDSARAIRKTISAILRTKQRNYH